MLRREFLKSILASKRSQAAEEEKQIALQGVVCALKMKVRTRHPAIELKEKGV